MMLRDLDPLPGWHLASLAVLGEPRRSEGVARPGVRVSPLHLPSKCPLAQHFLPPLGISQESRGARG